MRYFIRSGRDIVADPSAVKVPLDNFPSALANTGKLLQLFDGDNNLIDEVTYEKATPAKSWERSSSGWHLSSDPRGGTPGSVNSSGKGEEKPNEPDKPVTPDEPDEPDTPTIPLSRILPSNRESLFLTNFFPILLPVVANISSCTTVPIVPCRYPAYRSRSGKPMEH